jgi:hypothetical protein
MSSTDSECASPWGDAIIAVNVTTPASACEHCTQPFQPHPGKRFCSSRCRVAFHNAKRVSETPPETPSRFNETPQRISETAETVETPTPAPTPTPKVEDDPNDFHWHRDPEREWVVVRQQSAIAVYPNDNDDIVIRQQGDTGYVEDKWIVVSRQNLVPLIAALQRIERGEDWHRG